MERQSPGRFAAITGAHFVSSLALIAMASPLPEAEAILSALFNFFSCFDSPLVCVASGTAMTCII